MRVLNQESALNTDLSLRVTVFPVYLGSFQAHKLYTPNLYHDSWPPLSAEKQQLESSAARGSLPQKAKAVLLLMVDVRDLRQGRAKDPEYLGNGLGLYGSCNVFRRFVSVRFGSLPSMQQQLQNFINVLQVSCVVSP